jgi:hypothetical protein
MVRMLKQLTTQFIIKNESNKGKGEEKKKERT